MVRPSHLLGFIYLAPFLESAEAMGFGDADFRRLEAALLVNPEAGRRIPRTNGARKLRLGTKGRGKRGGARVIYFYRTLQGQIYMLHLYAKGRKDNLTRDEEQEIAGLIRMLEGDR